jgi:hypothetical protein
MGPLRLAERAVHTAQWLEPKGSAHCLPIKREGCLMFQVISANALLVWFVWGFFMALGWALGTWIMERLLGMVWHTRA